MMKLSAVLSSLLLTVFCANLFCQTSHASANVSVKATQIHNSAIVVDTHADTPQRFLDGNFDIGSTDPNDPVQITLDKARAGNLGAEFFSIWVEPASNQGHFAQK